MAKKRFQPEEIINKLRHADVLLCQGKKVAGIVKALGISDVTYSRWRQKFGGDDHRSAKRVGFSRFDARATNSSDFPQNGPFLPRILSSFSCFSPDLHGTVGR